MKKNYFWNSQKFAIRDIRKIPYENPTFFLGKLCQNLFFALHSHYTGDTQYRVWFDLDNSFTQWKKKLLLKFARIRNLRNSQNSVWKSNFFPRQALPKFFFAFNSHYARDTLYRVWFDLDNSLTRWKKTFFKIPENSQFAKFAKYCMKTQVFHRQVIPKIIIALHSHYAGDTPYRVWFELDNSLTRWKKNFFKIPKNSQFANFAKFCMKSQVFHRQVIPKVLFALHSHYTIDTPYRVWFDLDNSLTRWKRPIFKIPFSRSSKSSIWNTNFFPRQAMPKFVFCFTLSLHWWYSILSLVWFG